MLGGMHGVEEMDAGQHVFVLFYNVMLIWGGGGGERGEQGGGRAGFKRGCEVTGSAMRFSFIYLFH